MKTLGISFGYHDSSIAIIENNSVRFAISEERLTRQKHDANFPIHALKYGLERCDLKLEDMDQVVYHEDPFSKFSRVLASSLSSYPYAYREFAHSMKSWVGEKALDAT